MTKESNVTVNERLMVCVRVRPVDIFHRAVAVIDPQTLVLSEPSEYRSDGDSYRNGGGNYYSSSSTRSSSRLPNGQQNLNNGVHNGHSNSTYHQSNKVQQAEGKVYEFDRVFDEDSTQEEVYKNTAAPLVRSVLEGFCATVFAYGATGSGKTYTMVGTASSPGIMARSVDDIFKMCATQGNEPKPEVYLSYLEVYNEQIRDLLRPAPGIHLDLREDKDQNISVAGLSEIKATSTHEVLNLLQKGNRARTMEATGANVTSSRSHAVLLVTVRQISQESGDITDGKLYLIDLAGSERASNTKNSGIRLREGGHINRSLLALGNCITALASGDGDRYVNYRDSKLTRLLKAALGGPSKTAMIAHISPAVQQREETRNTLLYAQRARAISNRVRKFIYHPGQSTETSLVIQELRNEVKRLQSKLEEKETSISPAVTPIPHSMGYDYENAKRLDRPELTSMKKEIVQLFDEEFRLRNDLLKMDGAMLQSALDCEILRLMVLDWENLKTAKDSDGEASSASEDSDTAGKVEINSVMTELKQVRFEQDRLLQARNEVEAELKSVRGRIAQVEEEATQYLPETQREILSLLCKLQQDQVNKMSVEIEAELKRRGTLLLRCLRQKALGEAIIHRQRHFLNAINGTPSGTTDSGNGFSSSSFLPPLTHKPNSSEHRAFHTPPSGHSIRTSHLPPLSSASITPVTTKYSEYRKIRQHQRNRSSSDEDLDEKPERMFHNGTLPRKIRSNSPHGHHHHMAY